MTDQDPNNPVSDEINTPKVERGREARIASETVKSALSEGKINHEDALNHLSMIDACSIPVTAEVDGELPLPRYYKRKAWSNQGLERQVLVQNLLEDEFADCRNS
jgi:hypothetical protein